MSVEMPQEYANNTKYDIGTIELKHDYAKLITANDHQKLLIDKDNLNGAYHGDIVVVQKIFNPRARFKAKVIKVLQSSVKQILCYVKENELYSAKENVLIKGIDYSLYQDGDIVLCNNEKVVDYFGNIEDASIDEKISLYLFSEEYRLETKDYNEKSIVGKTINERIDLTDLPFCTIDPASAKDHDDAVYFDELNNTLYVAIADVSAYVEENSELDKDAYRRSLSMYMPNKVLPMLPPFLSEELCSLKPDVKRFAYTFKITFDDNNEVIEADLFESLIESKKKFSYGRIDRVLKGQYDLCDSQEREIFRSLEKLYKVTESLRKKRLEKGYDFRTSEYRLKLDNNGQLQKVNSEDSSPSHSLIEECMLQANIQAAKRLANNGIFRVHDEPNLQKINELITNINLLGLEITPKKTTHQTITYAQKRAKEVGLSSEIDELIIKAQQQAHYASKNGGHFGLGFEHYSHFTSPIRRYSDLILHRILKTNKVPGTIDVMCEHISNQERNITSCVWDLEDRKYARWAQKNIGKKVLAKIVDVEKAQVKLLEEATGATVVLTNYAGQKLFKKVTIKIINSNIYSKNIYAEVIA